MATPGYIKSDQHYSSSLELAMQRVAAIYQNSGITPDYSVLQRQAQAAVGNYQAFDQIRASVGTGTGGTGGGGDAKPENPAIDYRAYAPSWMTGPLLDVFVEHWSTTGDAGLAMEAVRRSPTYDTVFYGNRREDGTLRYAESEWFSVRDAFTETLSEFGQATPDKAFLERLFRNDVSSTEFYRGVESGYSRFTEPGGQTHSQLMNAYLQAFSQSGSAVAGLEAARSDASYDTVFAGNRREDGTIRMDEPEFFAYKRGWQRTLATYGLDPSFFEGRGRFKAAVEGELSIAELDERIDTQEREVFGNRPEVVEWYATNYGLETSREAILGAAIDPDLENDVLSRRVRAGQIGGEAQAAGFLRNVERAEALARAGISQSQARDLYAQAGQQLPGLSATTQRFFRGETSIGDFEDVFALGDADGRSVLTRALEQEESNFGSRSDTARDRDGFGLRGLRQR